MKNKLFTRWGKKLISFICFGILLLNVLCGSVSAQSKTYTVGEMENLIDGIVAWKMAQTNCNSVQQLINNGLSPDAGTSPTDWYIVALRQYKNSYDYSAYAKALNRYVGSMKGAKPTDLQRIAIAYSAIGGKTAFIQNTANDSIGKLGIMSYVYGLILLDSGAYTSTAISRNDCIENILSLAKTDGGWALSGKVSDVDVTAMAIQALAPYYSYNDVKTAVDKALTKLSHWQLENGDYASWGKGNAESTAQVITALSALNINYQTDRRFIKNGHNLIDGLLLYKLPDGSFSHPLGGNSNNNASVQAMYSLVASWRQSKGFGALYKFTPQTIARETPHATESKQTSKPGETLATQSSVISESVNFEEPSYSTNETGALTESTTADTPNAAIESAETTGTQYLSETTLSGTRTETQVEGTSYSYKIWAFSIIGLLGLFAIGLLYKIKKNHIKNIVLVLALTAGAMLAVLFTNIQTVDEYYLTHIDDIQPDSKTVSISIRCDTATDKLSADYLPPDGCILDNTRYVLRNGDTVFTVLERAVKHNKIQMEYQGAAANSLGSVYIKGINYLYEYDCGNTSGWMYKVNGKFTDVGCSDYVLSDGDLIEWVYTCELGKDVSNE